MRVLETQNIILKPIEVDDLKFLLNLRWDNEIMKYLIHDPISFKTQNDWFNNLKKTDVVLSIFVKKEEDEIIIGTIGLYDIDYRHQRAVWRIRLSKDFQGKGYAKEAINLLLDYGFNTLNLNKITSDSLSENEAIIKLTLKLGFKKEGLLINHYFNNGKYRDAILFGLLREEFNKK